MTTQVVKNGIDGIMARERYLLADKHPNHKNTEALISLIGNKYTSQRIAIEGEKYRLKQKLTARKGGRPLSSYAMEFCLTLPKGNQYRPSKQQWKAITADCCNALALMLNLNKDEKIQFAKLIRAVIHQQKQDGRRGTGDHIHIIVGKVLGLKVLKELQQKKATKIMKMAFNTAVLTHVGISNKNYQPYELNRGKKLENWRYQFQKAEESVTTQKLIVKLQNQADKWFKAHEKRDLKQFNRQFNRLAKTFEQLSDSALCETSAELTQRLKNDIEKKAGRKF